MTNKASPVFNLYRSSFFNSMAVVCIFCFGVVPVAQAYLDPGSFSFVIQTLIAALVGALFVLKNYWISVKNWFTGKGQATADPEKADGEIDKSRENQDKGNQ